MSKSSDLMVYEEWEHNGVCIRFGGDGRNTDRTYEGSMEDEDGSHYVSYRNTPAEVYRVRRCWLCNKAEALYELLIDRERSGNYSANEQIDFLLSF